MKTAIVVCGDQLPVRFAAQELSRYLRLATGRAVPIARKGSEKEFDVVFRLGVAGDLGLAVPGKLTDDDDWISIRPEKEGYVLTGSNPRSVLLAAYRYLQALGFRWIRPGKRGEIIPRLKTPVARNLRIAEAASYRYRTICIEGACSFEHVRDLIDWETKQGMNGYFIQFDLGTHFWARWYEHKENPRWKAEPFSSAKAAEIVRNVIAEIERRGLRFERMGHGWTCAALDVPGEGWGEFQQEIPAARKSWMAELNGKRELFHGVPLNTNLCFSNPDVRAAMAQKIVDYARCHPQVHGLHVWLADGSNNNCECPACRAARPADFYVQLLNEIDAGLAAAGLPTRIVFLIYVDLMWPPLASRLNNPSRFILMFAPITRSYFRSFAAAQPVAEHMTDYVRNKLEFPKSAGANLEYLRAWQQQFQGDGFDFDYHLIWACYYDLNHFTIGKVLHEDIRSLGAVGLHGLNSCQNQRQSYPHNLLMDVMAKTLWNKKASFSKIARDSFADAFGRDGQKAEAFFRAMSELWKPFFEPVYIPKKDEARVRRGLQNLPRMEKLAAGFRAVVRRNLRHPVPAIAWSWKYAASYLQLLDRLLPAYRAYLEESPDTRKLFEKVFDFLCRQERTTHPALDVSTCITVLKWRCHEMETYVKEKSGQ